jgi:hypothetical protein
MEDKSSLKKQKGLITCCFFNECQKKADEYDCLKFGGWVVDACSDCK